MEQGTILEEYEKERSTFRVSSEVNTLLAVATFYA
jgi:hypothetical protein